MSPHCALSCTMVCDIACTFINLGKIRGGLEFDKDFVKPSTTQKALELTAMCPASPQTPSLHPSPHFLLEKKGPDCMVLAGLQVLVPLSTPQGLPPPQKLPSLGAAWSDVYLFMERSITDPFPELENSWKTPCVRRLLLPRLTCLEKSMCLGRHTSLGEQ